MEYRVRRKDGEYRWILDAGVPRFNSDGSFAGYIGSAVDVTERRQAEEALSTVSQRLIEAHEQERTSIARELHDDINQRLAIAAVTLDDIKYSATSQHQLVVGIDGVMEQVRELCGDIQIVSHRLHNSKLDQLGLKVSAESFCKEIQERHKVLVEFHAENVAKEMPRAVALCLFRVLQEALQNALKHSGTTMLYVSLIGRSDRIQLTIRDAGKGFDSVQVLRTAGIGLAGMKERLKLVNGQIDIDSRPGGGTVVCASVFLECCSNDARSLGETLDLPEQHDCNFQCRLGWQHS